MVEEVRYIENKEFVALEEEDIQKLNRIETQKFDNNPEIIQKMAAIEAEFSRRGHWEEHWVTVDESGRRVYARIYYADEKALALTADGQIVRKIDYPLKLKRDLH